MEKQLHIWMGQPYCDADVLYTNLEDTEKALKMELELIHTTQPHVCSTTYLVKGYRIFVHMLDDDVVEMKLGHIGDNMKEIRVSHNLEKMLLAGCFGMATID